MDERHSPWHSSLEANLYLKRKEERDVSRCSVETSRTQEGRCHAAPDSVGPAAAWGGGCCILWPNFVAAFIWLSHPWRNMQLVEESWHDSYLNHVVRSHNQVKTVFLSCNSFSLLRPHLARGIFHRSGSVRSSTTRQWDRMLWPTFFPGR